MKNYRPVELLGTLPGVKRIDSHTVQFEATGMADVNRLLGFVTGYAPDLAP